MNMQVADTPVQWMFLDLNAFFASCEQQENPSLRRQPVIVVQTLTHSAVAIAAIYAAKAFGIKTGTLMRASCARTSFRSRLITGSTPNITSAF
jgi:DNA polymerase-4